MENRIVISICGEEYTLLADEAPSYMQKVGQYVDSKMSETLRGAKVGRTDAAVLTALNLADELMKAQQNAENLRSQLKGYLDEANRAKSEVSELKRELFRLQNNNRGGNQNQQNQQNHQNRR
ncbi:MAG: cell division protein ZapA [Oscillospiraceae bacterium]